MGSHTLALPSAQKPYSYVNAKLRRSGTLAWVSLVLEGNVKSFWVRKHQIRVQAVCLYLSMAIKQLYFMERREDCEV